MSSFIDDLADIPALNDLDRKSKPARRAVPTFPCESCGGTGVYRGTRVHQERSECFACKGKGYFMTSEKDRRAKRAKAAARKSNKVDTFIAQNAALVEGLRALSSWNDFARSMLEQVMAKGSLSPAQIAAAERQIAKGAARDAERAKARAEREANAPRVDMQPILAMFETARASGLKRLAFVAGGLRISPAPAHGANAGHLYVKAGDSYQGKVKPDGRFLAVGSALPDTLEKLLEIAANPSEQARDYGKRTGKCCCCGRELTDPASIAAGIGPVCASNWGL